MRTRILWFLFLLVATSAAAQQQINGGLIIDHTLKPTASMPLQSVPVTANHTVDCTTEFGKVLDVTSSTPIVITLPATCVAGTVVYSSQNGVGAVSFISTSGLFDSPFGFTSIGVVNGFVVLRVKTNSNGSLADWQMSGAISP